MREAASSWLEAWGGVGAYPPYSLPALKPNIDGWRCREMHRRESGPDSTPT